VFSIDFGEKYTQFYSSTLLQFLNFVVPNFFGLDEVFKDVFSNKEKARFSLFILKITFFKIMK
jgi:hypothetical protein